MEKLKLSVIICTYNRANLLPEALDSVLSQKTDFDFEIIVGDDASTDGTRNLLNEYQRKHPDKIVLSLMETNSGIGANWATALMKAHGKYVAFLDDDDYWMDEKRMQIMVDFLENHPEYDVLYTNAVSLDEKTGKRRSISYPSPEEYDAYKLWKGELPNIQLNTLMVKKTLVEESINLKDYVEYQFPIQDWNTHILLLRKARFAYMDMPTSVLRVTDGSLSRPKTYEQVEAKYKKEKIMCKYLAEQFIDDDKITFDEVGYDSYIYHILTTVAFQRGDYREAKRFSQLSGDHSMRAKCTKTWITFHLYRLARFLRKTCN